MDHFLSISAHFVEYVAWNACTLENCSWFFNQHHDHQNCPSNLISDLKLVKYVRLF